MLNLGLMPQEFLDRDELVALGILATSSRTAFQKFSGYLSSLENIPVHTTTPSSSHVPTDPLNVAVVAIDALNGSLRQGLCTDKTQYGSLANRMVVRILDYLFRWITYFIDYIIIPGREGEFDHDFAELSATLIAHLVDQKRHPTLYGTVTSKRHNISDRQRGKPVFLLSSILPALLLDDKSSSPASRRQSLSQCFRALSLLIHDHPQRLPQFSRELLDRVCYDLPAVSSIFSHCIIDAVGLINSEDCSRDAFELPLHLLRASYGFTTQLLVRRPFIEDSMQRGRVHWTCEVLAAVRQSKILLRVCTDPDSMTMFDKDTVLSLTYNCCALALSHLEQIVLLLGPHAAKQIYNGNAIAHLLTIQSLLSKHHRKGTNSYQDGIRGFLVKLAPYLTYYSVLKPALRSQVEIEKALTPEFADSSEWKAYRTHLMSDMLELRQEYQENQATICDSRSVSGF